MSQRFTVTGSQAFEEELRVFLEQLADEFEEIFGRRTVALALGGGYGRGEGGVWREEGKEGLYNDLDLVWIHRDKRLSTAIRQELSAFESRYQERAKIHVDIMPIAQAAVAELPPALTWYEFGHGHRMLLGDSDVFQPLVQRCLEGVTPDEWGRLLMNRSAGIVFARWVMAGAPPALAQGEPAEEFVQRQVMKAWLALGDVQLVDAGRYHRLVSERKVRAQEFGTSFAYLEKYLNAISFKFDPTPAPSLDEISDEIDEVSRLLEPQLRSRIASPHRPTVGLYATLFHVAPQHWLSLRPDLYPRERLRFAFAAELAGAFSERQRLVGNQNNLVNLWSRYA